MSSHFTGPIQGSIHAEIDKRLRAALAPTALNVINDSGRHSGHAGDDGSGESHFTIEIESPELAGLNRLQRQRAVFAALGDLVPRIHAIAIKASAGEG